MFYVSPRRESVRLDISIDPPIFDWNRGPSKFFAMLHGTLGPELNVEPGNFTVVPANNLGEVVARYNVFGGNSSVSLHAAKLSMDFPTLLPQEGTLVQDILSKVDRGFRNAFSGHRYATIQVMRSVHAEFLQDGAVSEYLSRFVNPSVDKVFGLAGAVTVPGIRFGVIDSSGRWRVWCQAERSESLDSGLFVILDVMFLKLDANDDFDVLLEQYSKVVDSCTTALELEWKIGI